jgi:hypothetical protein
MNIHNFISTDNKIVCNGQLPEWPNGADCKSAVYDFGGSNPPLPTENNLELLNVKIAQLQIAQVLLRK